jgi:hypothetical protein
MPETEETSIETVELPAQETAPEATETTNSEPPQKPVDDNDDLRQQVKLLTAKYKRLSRKMKRKESPEEANNPAAEVAPIASPKPAKRSAFSDALKKWSEYGRS